MTEKTEDLIAEATAAWEAAGRVPQGAMVHETQWKPFAALYNVTERFIDALAAQPVLDPERVKTWLQREFGSVLAHDPHNPEQFWGGSARALCEAAKRGELT